MANNKEKEQRTEATPGADERSAEELDLESRQEEVPTPEERLEGAEEREPEQEPAKAAPPEGEPEEETVEGLKKELEASRDKYIRLMAEFDNYKRRTSREYERMVEKANERLMLDIIEVRESFERALKSGKENAGNEGFFEGMKMIFGKLDEILQRNGLSVFTEAGEEFDPQVHDALMKTPHDSIPADHIAEVFEKGYKLRNHVIKHGRVIVSSGPGEETADMPSDNQEDQTENE
jgi:molecular chaperone GrpE